jgi:hypothetical protein
MIAEQHEADLRLLSPSLDLIDQTLGDARAKAAELKLLEPVTRSVPLRF